MLPEWGRFVTVVKLNKGLRESNYDQLYAYLKQHETYAKENKMMLECFSQHTVDPLALMSNVSHPQHYSPSSSTLTSIYVPLHLADNAYLDSSLSPTDNLIKPTRWPYSPNHSKPSYLKPTINSELHPIQGTKLQFKMAELWFRMVRVDIIEAQENRVALDAKQLLFLTGGQDNAIDDDYVKDNAVPVVHSNVSSVPSDAYMMIYNDMNEPRAQSVFNTSRNTVVENLLNAKLATNKEQVEL
nr:hypothetical protein [Tanacetum cinerariifolium]